MASRASCHLENVKIEIVARSGTVVYVASKEVRAGEELIADYGNPRYVVCCILDTSLVLCSEALQAQSFTAYEVAHLLDAVSQFIGQRLDYWGGIVYNLEISVIEYFRTEGISSF